MKKSKLHLALMIAALSSLSLVGCQQEPPVAPEKQVQTISALVQEVQLGAVPMTAVVPGSIVPDQRARIASRLMGYIKDMSLQVGQEVKRGEVLFSIDSSDISSQIAQARAAYQQADAALKDAKLDYDRFSKLYKDNTVSKQQFDKIRLQYSVAQENLTAAKSGLDQAKAQLKYANVAAPFDGVVVEKMASEGDLAAPGNPMVVLENRSSLSVQTEVSNELYAVLRSGDEAQVMIDGKSEPVVGTVYTLVSAANPMTRTHTVKLSIPNTDNINSGTFARVIFNRGERQTIMVPSSAVIDRSGVEGVFVVNDGKAYFNMVRTGAEIGDLVEIQSGLNLGERIVVSNNASMLNGDLVQEVGQ